MIYQFHGGPEDGLEKEIPEQPIGSVYRVPVTPAQIIKTWWDIPPELECSTVSYRVTDVGDMTFEPLNS